MLKCPQCHNNTFFKTKEYPIICSKCGLVIKNMPFASEYTYLASVGFIRIDFPFVGYDIESLKKKKRKEKPR